MFEMVMIRCICQISAPRSSPTPPYMTMKSFWQRLTIQKCSSILILFFKLYTLGSGACCPSPVCMSIRLSVCKLHIPIFFSRTTGPVSTKLGTKHPWPWVKGIQVCSNEGPRSLLMRVNNEILDALETFRKILLQNHRTNFNQTWHKTLFKFV